MLIEGASHVYRGQRRLQQFIYQIRVAHNVWEGMAADLSRKPRSAKSKRAISLNGWLASLRNSLILPSLRGQSKTQRVEWVLAD